MSSKNLLFVYLCTSKFSYKKKNQSPFFVSHQLASNRTMPGTPIRTPSREALNFSTIKELTTEFYKIPKDANPAECRAWANNMDRNRYNGTFLNFINNINKMTFFRLPRFNTCSTALAARNKGRLHSRKQDWRISGA